MQKLLHKFKAPFVIEGQFFGFRDAQGVFRPILDVVEQVLDKHDLKRGEVRIGEMGGTFFL
jgi:hypothetical protein